ncbi:MAG TPA: hypothetical protein VHB49_00385 [Bradyrhizobium sp.]|nr:hypothetical protein [Bradyrhizobium sp.]
MSDTARRSDCGHSADQSSNLSFHVRFPLQCSFARDRQRRDEGLGSWIGFAGYRWALVGIAPVRAAGLHFFPACSGTMMSSPDLLDGRHLTQRAASLFAR